MPSSRAETSQFQVRLRELLAERRMSFRTLAAKTYYSKSYLHDLAAGKKMPTFETAQRIDDALAARGYLAGTVVEPDERGSSSPCAITPALRHAVRLSVAIAVVVADFRVLLVCRRDFDRSGITWQFPAGIVKPRAPADLTAIRETLAETAIHCAVRSELGGRVHPLTSVYCQYFLCDYLAGDVENRDATENVSAIWAAKQDITRFIPADRIFPPILDALEVGARRSPLSAEAADVADT